MKTQKNTNTSMKAAALLISGMLAVACGGNKPEMIGPLPPMVKTVSVDGSAGNVLELRGNVAPQGRLRLGFKMPGIVASMRVREGDQVRAGQLLAVLDDADAQAQSRSAKAEFERAKRDAERSELLVREGALPMNQRDDSRNQLESSEAQWKQAQDGMCRTRLLAPISGTVFQRLAEPGETAAPGTPVLVLDTTNQLVVKAGVTERDLRRLKVGQRVQLIPENAVKPFPGIVKSLGASPNASDGLYPVEVAPDGPTVAGLQSGSLLKIRVEGAKRSEGIRVPFPALVHRQDGDFVFVVQKSGQDETVKARPVVVAKADGIGVMIERGLAAGERVIAEGAFFLLDGQTVRVLE